MSTRNSPTTSATQKRLDELKKQVDATFAQAPDIAGKDQVVCKTCGFPGRVHSGRIPHVCTMAKPFCPNFNP
jgi:hypothetical protein